MSVGRCPKCQEEIPDEIKICVRCGYQLINDVENGNNSSRSVGKTKKRIFVYTIISIFIVIAILFCSIGLPRILSNQLTLEEEIALRNVQDLKDRLKDPDSLKLYDDVLVVFYTGKEYIEEVDFFSYIDYGAKNSYGAMNRNTALYSGYDYIGTMEDAEDIDVIKITFSGRSLTDNEMRLLRARLAYLSYQLSKEEAKSYEIVDREKIMRKLG